MVRKRSVSSIKQRLFANNPPVTVIYCEGKHEYTYLDFLVKKNVIRSYERGTKLTASDIVNRMQAIRYDMANEAIERIFWIVDGGDEHIKQGKKKKGKNCFSEFYSEWLSKKDQTDEKERWGKLLILLNTPCLEYWFLLHRLDPPIHSNGNFICFNDATELENSEIFKASCPEGKGDKLVSTVANDSAGRKRAVRRAKELNTSIVNTNLNELFSVARAEIYQLIERIATNPYQSFSENVIPKEENEDEMD